MPDGHRDVRRREPEQPTTLVAGEHLATHLVRASEHGVGTLDVAAGERPPDGRAADRLVDSVETLDELDRFDIEVGLDADLAEQVDVAVAMASEVEVLADDDDPGLQASHQHAIDERLGALGGLGLVEGDDRRRHRRPSTRAAPSSARDR